MRDNKCIKQPQKKKQQPGCYELNPKNYDSSYERLIILKKIILYLNLKLKNYLKQQKHLDLDF
jgi:hypothetical protein